MISLIGRLFHWSYIGINHLSLTRTHQSQLTLNQPIKLIRDGENGSNKINYNSFSMLLLFVAWCYYTINFAWAFTCSVYINL